MHKAHIVKVHQAFEILGNSQDHANIFLHMISKNYEGSLQ